MKVLCTNFFGSVLCAGCVVCSCPSCRAWLQRYYSRCIQCTQRRWVLLFACKGTVFKCAKSNFDTEIVQKQSVQWQSQLSVSRQSVKWQSRPSVFGQSCYCQQTKKLKSTYNHISIMLGLCWLFLSTPFLWEPSLRTSIIQSFLS